jgi:hypothetical protein
MILWIGRAMVVDCGGDIFEAEVWANKSNCKIS